MRVTPHHTLHQPATVVIEASRVQIDQHDTGVVEINVQRPDRGTTTVRVIAEGMGRARMAFVGHTDDTLHTEQEVKTDG